MIDIDPNSSGLPGIEQLRIIVGAVMTVGLILSVLALIISAIVWGFGANSSNPHLASRGKVGVLVSCGAAIICGASPADAGKKAECGQDKMAAQTATLESMET